MEARDGYGRHLETEDERGEELKGEKIRLTGVGIHADRLGPDLAGRREGIYNILFVMHNSWIFATDKKSPLEFQSFVLSVLGSMQLPRQH